MAPICNICGHPDVNPGTMWSCPDCLHELRLELAQLRERFLTVRQQRDDALSEVAQWKTLNAVRLADAHAYNQQYLLPQAAGADVWGSILDDAIRLRAKLADVERLCRCW